MSPHPPRCRALPLAALPLFVAALFFMLACSTSSAEAAVLCPNSNPVVNENNCMGAGSTGYKLTDYEQGGIAGYATQASVNLGSSVTLRIALPGGNGKAEVTVYRMGWYGGTGGRLVYTAKNVSVTNNRNCENPEEATGYWSCGNWENTLTVPGSSLPASGIYIAHIKNTADGEDNQIIFTVRDDSRHSALLYKLPDGTYQAYNAYNGHSLYRFNSAGFTTVTGTSKAVRVSFERPYLNTYDEANWFFKADFSMVEWLEKEGYEVSYTDDTSVDANPGQLLNHKTLLISGHDEYWSENEMNGYEAARNAGVNIASFSGNTAYWKVRYENNGRTLVCFKSVEGYKAGEVPDGSKGVNDWGPDMKKGTADDAVGKDGIAGTADDNPQYATTTWRDNGAPRGDPNAPPEGRVGPNRPENALLGSMYVGDNDNWNYPFTIPATNEAGEYAGSRVWRNTGVSKTQSTTIGTNLSGWEWDTIPTQAQYLSREPAGVKRVSLTDVGTAPSPPEFIQDEGLMYAFSPPPGQSSSVSAVEYTDPSGAHVFSAGTIQWSWGLAPHYANKPAGETYEDPPVDSSDPRIQQATYNILADDGVEPQTPTGVIVDGNEPPEASFTVSPNPAATGSPVTFNASASKDPDGTIAKYEWDLDGDGTYETSTGTTPTITKTYTAAGEVSVHLRVTDNSGATEEAVRTVKVSNGSNGNIFPTAAFTMSPNPVAPGAQVTLNASGSSDPDGTIAKYEWDLDGNGSYETSTGPTPTVTTSFATAGTRQIGLRVTDNGGGIATTTHVLIVGAGSPYSSEIASTPGLLDYWRLGDSPGTTFADSAGSHPATAQGGVTLGVPGAIEADANTAASFDGGTGAAAVPLNLSGNNALTLEFWLNWSAYANNDALAFEFTPNFNNENGGFLVDPNAGELGGKFGIGIGREGSRNNAYFTRPSAGVWHHYAIVLNASAPAAQQIVPYVDGQPVSYEKLNSGTGAGAFANSTLYFMSRAASSLFGKGSLDEVALYNRALTSAEIAAHYQASRNNQPPTASFTLSGSPVSSSTPVTFDASASKDPDGTIAKYEWDLDGNGSYETSTGSTATVTKTYAAEGTYQVGLRVTDQGGATATATRTLVVANHLPTATFTVSPNPVSVGDQVTLDGTGSSDPDGPIAKYEWDLDGNGSYETSTAGAPTVKTSFSEPGTYTVGLRVTDGSGSTATRTQTVNVLGRYASAITSTSGLLDYWRLGDSPGTTFADSVGSHPATAQGGVTLGAAGAIEGEPTNTSASFDGTSGAASVPLDLSGSSQLTLEFWLNWSAYANNDALAFEFTPNFNNENGGFLVDPNAGELGGKFAVSLGREGSRNSAYFARPSAGVWHHYALVLNTAAPAAEEITPYVDGKAVPFEKTNSGTGAGSFANSTLYFMSRAASALFGKGGLDEVALYNRALSPAEIAAHYLARNSHNPPAGSFTATPNPAPTGTTVNFDAAGSTDSDGTIVKYEWDLDGNGTFETNTGGAPTASTTFAKAGQYQVGLRVTDDSGASSTTTQTVTVQDATPTASFTSSPAVVPIGTTVSLDASASKDPDGTIAKYEWDLDGNGSYETSTGSTATVTTSFAKAGEYQVGLRVTDNEGTTATTTRTVTVVGSYYQAIAQTPGLTDYWRLGERSGLIFADGVGGHNAAITGNVALGQTSALAGDPNASASFEGDGAAAAPLDLSGTSALTLEFWLNWSAWSNNDALAFELTPNFNENAGGFLVDPNAPQAGGTFGVGIGQEASRNTAYFERPSAGVWHHYAIVMNTQAPAAEQVLPYVDGKAVPFEKPDSGTGAGNFANSTLYFMSRAASALFGKGGLDEVALYNRALSPAEIAAHYEFGFNHPPNASLVANPTSVAAGLPVSLDASGSNDPDGTIAKYEWDLDGNGTFETNTGITPTASTTFDEAGEYQVGLRVTDDEGATTTTTRTITVHGSLPQAKLGVAPSPAPTGTQVTFDASASADADGPLTFEWDLDGNGSYETNTGSTATVNKTYAKAGQYTVGVRVKDTDGTTDTANATAVMQNRAPSAAIAATPNPVATGTAVNFSAGGSSDPDGTIAKYEWDLDGNGTYETTTTTPTTTKTYTAPGEYTVGVRVTDDEGATATATRLLAVQNRPPTASFTATPNPVPTGTAVAFNGSGSADPDGSIVKYEWDLDGNGTYETTTTTPTTTKTYTAPANLTIGLRVTDDSGATATTTRALTVQNRLPTASFTVTPNPATTGTAVAFNGSGSSDPDGTIAKYEWDLDGNGTYETTTTTPTTTKTYTSATSPTVGLRVTDNSGGTATTTRALTVRSAYNAAVLGTSGLTDYWRLGETSGTSLVDAIGGRTATAAGGVTLGGTGAIATDPDKSASFDGSNDTAKAALNLSANSALTVEFWLKWASYANDNKLAFEFTTNSGLSTGSFFIEPDSSEGSGRFGVGIGGLMRSNNALFARPSANVWHHYAIVFNLKASAAQQVIPYVDGVPVTYTKTNSSTGTNAFANSTLYFMSRAGSSRFGKGSLDEVAIYNRALTAAEIAAHFRAAAQ